MPRDRIFMSCNKSVGLGPFYKIPDYLCVGYFFILDWGFVYTPPPPPPLMTPIRSAPTIRYNSDPHQLVVLFCGMQKKLFLSKMNFFILGTLFLYLLEFRAFFSNQENLSEYVSAFAVCTYEQSGFGSNLP